MQTLWFAVMIVFAVIEMGTTRLWAIWISIGGTAALIAAILNGGVFLQFFLFFLVWALMFFGSKPLLARLKDGK